MRRALPASLAIHLGLLGGAYLLFTGTTLPDPDGVESMTVDVIPIVATTNVTPSEAEIEQSVPLVSAGADEVAPETEPEQMLEAETVETLDPVETATAETVEAEPPAEVEPLAEMEPPEEIEPPVELAEPMRMAVLPQPIEPQPIEPLPRVPVTEPVQPAVAEPPPAETAAEPMAAEEVPQVLTAAPLGPDPIEDAMPVSLAADAPELAAAEAIEPDLEPVPEELAAQELAPQQPLPETPAEAVPEQVEPIELALADPAQATPLTAELTEEFETAPVPRPRTDKQVSEPTYPEEPVKKAEPKKAEPKKAEPEKKKVADKKPEKKTEKAPPRKQRVANVGNGGQNQADAAAGKASGGKGRKSEAGNAEVTKYPGVVRQRLNRNLRAPKGGDRGEVHVAFVVSRGGQVSNIAIVRSSGSSRLDEAALATVKRAAPFPPIPEAAGRSTWPFTIPLAFTR